MKTLLYREKKVQNLYELVRSFLPPDYQSRETLVVEMSFRALEGQGSDTCQPAWLELWTFGRPSRATAGGSREKLMSITPIGHPFFTKADLAVLLTHGHQMVDQGYAGACVPVETEDGELVVALLDQTSQQILCAFGKAEGWYYAFDSMWSPIAQGRLIEDVLDVLPGVLEPYRPIAANAY